MANNKNDFPTIINNPIKIIKKTITTTTKIKNNLKKRKDSIVRNMS